MSSPLRFDGWARAAMLGMLASQSVACSGHDDETNSTGSGGSHAVTTESTGSDAGGSDATTSETTTSDVGGSDVGGSDATTSETTSSDAGSSQGGSAAPMGILSSKVVPDLSLEDFSEECREAGGIVETHGHCSGMNSCKGFSYDSDTDLYTVHTCRGYNTCSGFSCVVPDE